MNPGEYRQAAGAVAQALSTPTHGPNWTRCGFPTTPFQKSEKLTD